MIELSELTKYYGKTLGIENVCLKVEKGEIFGFLGPNGAGNTTTIRLMLDLIRPTSGKALIMGYDCNKEPDKVKEVIEYLPGDFAAYPELTCKQYLSYIAGFYSDPDVFKKAEELAEYFDLDTSRNIRQCSKGMKQKVGLIQALMVDCPLYILDEPSGGLDPLIQQVFYSLLEQEKKKGKTIFFSSHQLTEVERVCDRVGIIRKGHIIEIDSVSNLKNKTFKEVEIWYVNDIPDNFFEKKGIQDLSEDGLNIKLKIVSNIGENLHHLTSIPVKDIQVKEPSLEKIFLEYYGEET